MSRALSSSSDPLNQLSLLVSLSRYIFFVIPSVTRSHRISDLRVVPQVPISLADLLDRVTRMIDSHDPCFFYLIDLVSSLICIGQFMIALWFYETLDFFSLTSDASITLDNLLYSTPTISSSFHFNLSSFILTNPRLCCNIAILRKLKSYFELFFQATSYNRIFSSLYLFSRVFFIRPSDF